MKGYKLIPKTIESVLSQKCEDYEIWILRNDITDLPKGIDAEERETVCYGENITIKELLIRECGKGNALNEGIKRANGDIIAVVDADCILQEGALKTAVKHFANDAVAAVGGRLLVMIEDESLLEKIQSFEYMKSFQFARRIWNKLHAQCLISGAFGLFRKRDLLEIGGYDTDTVGEDMEVVLRLQNDGYRRTSKQIVYEPNALCATGVPHNMKKLLRQRDRWQRGLIDCLSKHHMMILNPNYALLGILTLGYQLGFEMMGPLLCTAGLGWIAFGYGGPKSWLFVTLYIALELGIAIIAEYYEVEKNARELFRRLPGLMLLTVISFSYQVVIMVARVYGIITFRRRRTVW